MEQTVKELLHDAIFYDEPFLAHAIYYAVQEGLVQLGDPESRIPYGKLDYEAIQKMKNDNWLKMCTIKLFVVPMRDRRFAVYLAAKVDDVWAKHYKIYGGQPPRVMDVSRKMDTSVYCVETGISRSFRELKREAVRFPYYVGEMG